ncbi:chitinase [Streptomyces sp. NPDC093085]|uniref:chitinase n=1 Tax=Streptomyces sp. NPDC093085 TaxID=3155068 RepID=UPI00344A4AF8
MPSSPSNGPHRRRAYGRPTAWAAGLTALALALACSACSTGTAADADGARGTGKPPGQAPAGEDGGKEPDFAPYVSATTASALDTAGSPGTYNLAFVITGGTGSCTPVWGGTAAYDSAAVKARVAELTASGGSVRVSFGGASGTEPALGCDGVDALVAAYGKALDAVGATKADFDIEGDALTDTASIALRNKAIARLQQDRDLDVTYTLPVMPDGLEKSGRAILADAAERGVKLSAVNIMAMNYGSTYTGDMADYAEQAATAAHTQLTEILGLSSPAAWKALHITPMAGVNDVTGETFTLADAARLRRFARQKGVGALSLWATFRDQACAEGVSTTKASDTCSGVDQSAGAFAKALSSDSGSATDSESATDSGSGSG